MIRVAAVTRRRTLAGAIAATAGLAVAEARAQEKMPRRPIPATGELLPVIGLGSSKGVAEIGKGAEPQIGRAHV